MTYIYTTFLPYLDLQNTLTTFDTDKKLVNCNSSNKYNLNNITALSLTNPLISTSF